VTNLGSTGLRRHGIITSYTQTLKGAPRAVVKRFHRLFFVRMSYEGSSNMIRSHHRKHSRCHRDQLLQLEDALTLQIALQG
jgi:hypothetical protein